VPELPEVQALVDFLNERTAGLAVAEVELASFSVLKTFDPPPSALAGAPVDGWSRHGKFLELDADGIHLVFHLARAGWLRWSDSLPHPRMRPGKSPIALRVRFSDDSGFDLTEAGTKKSLAAPTPSAPNKLFHWTLEQKPLTGVAPATVRAPFAPCSTTDSGRPDEARPPARTSPLHDNH